MVEVFVLFVKITKIMRRINAKIIIQAVLITLIVIIIDLLGIAFLALKTVSIPFVPNRNIDKMSDFYTAIWQNTRTNSIDNGKFEIIDITDYSRSDISQILRTISNMNPKVIGLDISFITKEDSVIDSRLVKTIQSIPNIVLPVEYQEMENGSEVYNYSIFRDQYKNKEYGVVSFPNVRDVIRTFKPRYQIDNQSIDAFSFVIAKKLDKNLSIENLPKEMLINFTTLKLEDEDAIQGFQFLNLKNNDSIILASTISNKIVLIGGTRHTSDQHLTPLGSSISGLMIHAHIINFLIDKRILHQTPKIIQYILCFILAIFAIYWFKLRCQSEDKHRNLLKSIIKWLLLFITSVIIFAVIGTLLFCKYSYYCDFSPFIVTIIIVDLYYKYINNYTKL